MAPGYGQWDQSHLEDGVSRHEHRVDHALRWYPAAWRERYGRELIDLLVDTNAERPLTWRARLALARAGLIERGHYSGVIGRRARPEDQVRAGALRVGFAWACFVVAGAAFAKFSEHWDVVTPSAHRALPESAMTLLQLSSFASAGLCVFAAAVSFPSWWRYVRTSGLGRAVRLLRPGLFAALVGVASSSAVIELAHHSTSAQRNGGRGAYAWLGLAWSALLVSCFAVLAWNVGSLVRRLEFSRRQLRILSLAARLLAALMVVIFVSFLVWWVAIAEYARTFLTTGLSGVSNPSIPLPMLASATLMVTRLFVALWGVRRSWRQLA